MTKLVCDFQFDGATYCVTAKLDTTGAVVGIDPVLNEKGAHAEQVYQRAAVLAALMRDGLPFTALQELKSPGPIATAIIAGVERRACTAARSLTSHGQA